MAYFSWIANSGGYGAYVVSGVDSDRSIFLHMYGTGSDPLDRALLADSVGDTYTLGFLGDYIVAGAGDDLLYGGTSATGVVGGGVDALFGGSGADRIEGGVGADRMSGGAGSDWLFYQRSRGGVYVDLALNKADSIGFVINDAYGDIIDSFENVAGSQYGDQLVGNDLDNELNGLGGNDTLSGGAGYNQLRGAEGNDLYILGVGRDWITDNSGFDTVRFTNASSINFNTNSSSGDPSNDLWNDTDMERFEGSAGNDSIILTITGGGAKQLIGGAGNDTLGGRAGDDLLAGDTGNDSLRGEAGRDTLLGGTGNDTISGGVGVDTASFASHFGAVSGGWTIDLNNANLRIQTARTTHLVAGVNVVEMDLLFGIENAIGSAGNDVFKLGLFNTITGGAGTDTVYFASTGLGTVATAADDYVLLGQGTSFSASTSYAFSGVEIFHTGIGQDTVQGSSAADVAFGDAGNDYLYGQGGNDRLYGGTEIDVLAGGFGRDTLSGGSGADRFLFNTTPVSASNSDIITDFAHLIDDFHLVRGIFTRLGASVDAAELRQGTVALDANDFLIYTKGTGRLYYDADGNGAAAQTLIATLVVGTVVSTADFVMTIAY